MRVANAILRIVIIVMAIALLCSPRIGLAQSTGSVSGQVHDPSGALIPGAEVSIRNLATNLTYNTLSNELGTFEFPAVQIGNYELTVKFVGFKTAVVPSVEVNVGIKASVAVKMEVGGGTDSVTVIEEAQQVINTISAELSNIIDRRQVMDLPLSGRNPISLARLQAGVAVSSGTNERTGNINGLRGTMTNLTQDGINIQDNAVRGCALFSQASGTLENTGEVTIAVGTINSDSGTGAAQVKLVTPSGTNQFHGSLFEFHRNSVLNANTFFNNQSGTPKARQIQNRFGGRLGGPIKIPGIYDGKDRTFFFTAVEIERVPSQTTRNRTVWTDDARRGIFKYRDTAGAVQQVNLLQVAPTARSINPITQQLLSETPPLHNTDAADGLNPSGYRFLSKEMDKSNRFTLRIDHKLTEHALGGQHNLEVVINRHKFLNSPDVFNNGDSAFPGGVIRYIDFRRFITAVALHSTLGNHMYKQLRSGMITAPVWFARSAPDPRGVIIPFTVGNSPQEPTGQTSYRNAPVYHLIDNFSWVAGTHSLKMGFELRSTSDATWNEAGLVQTINVGTNASNPDGLLLTMFPGLTGTATSNTVLNNAKAHYQLLTGLLNNSTRTFNVANLDQGGAFIPGVSNYKFRRYREWDLYLSDQWRWRSNFTWNLGLRYELVFPMRIVNGGALLPEKGLDSLFGISGANNLFRPNYMPGTAQNNLTFAGTDDTRPLWNLDKNNFAPFIGFAYQPGFQSGIGRLLFGSGKSSVRAGYSISYTRESIGSYDSVINGNQGLSQTITTAPLTGVLTSAGVPITTPNFKVPLTDVETYGRPSRSCGFWAFDPNLRTPYVQQWSFGIEREVPGRIAIEARYVGNHAQQLLRGINFNEVNIFENGFLEEFKNAQKNLQINGGTSFAPGAAGTVPLPIMSTLFSGIATGSAFTNSTFIQNLTNGAAGTMAFALANGATYKANRANLPANFFLANPNLNFARYTMNASHSTYNAFQLEARRRFATGFFLQSNYTFAKNLTDGESAASDPYRTLRNASIEKHLADWDIRHTFNTNWLYDLP